jgi:PilZ domain-containing protein
MKRAAGISDPEPDQRVDQRREPRRPARGDIRFSFPQGEVKLGSREVWGRLLDRSTSGFRAEHDCAELTSGQEVRFRMSASVKGKARVVWTRIQAGRVETGFLILP